MRVFCFFGWLEKNTYAFPICLCFLLRNTCAFPTFPISSRHVCIPHLFAADPQRIWSVLYAMKSSHSVPKGGSRALRKQRSHATEVGCLHRCAEQGVEHGHTVLLVFAFWPCRTRRRLPNNRTTLLRLLAARLLRCSLCGTG